MVVRLLDWSRISSAARSGLHSPTCGGIARLLTEPRGAPGISTVRCHHFLLSVVDQWIPEVRAVGVSALPARSTSRVISYATRPRSLSAAARTARQEPSLMLMMSISPRSISTTVLATAPPSHTRDAPWVSLDRPEAIAAILYARASWKPSRVDR